VPWNSGGSIAVVLARRDDAALRRRVSDLLAGLQADPANRIAAVIDTGRIAEAGGNPQADFYVNLGEGVMAGSFRNGTAPLLRPSSYKGMHGYFPDDPRMRSTFLLMGPGVPRARDLGLVDMRAIAPTLAHILSVELPDAEVRAVELGKPAP
jgi:hypothetical protein